MEKPIETPEKTAQDKKLKDYAEAIAFYLEHPEAMKDSISKAYVESIRKMLENPQKQLETSQNGL